MKFNKLHSFIKAELYMNILTIIGFSIMGPTILKLKGVEFTVLIISLLMMTSKLSIIISYFIKHMDMYTKHRIMLIVILCDIVVTFSYSILPIDVWIIGITLSELLVVIIMSAFYIDYDTILADMLNKEDFRNLQYIERIGFSVAGLVGLGISMLTSNEIYIYSIYLGNLFIIGSFIIGVTQHRKYYKRITLDNYEEIIK